MSRGRLKKPEASEVSFAGCHGTLPVPETPPFVTLMRMADVTQLLDAAAAGDPKAAAELLPLVYDELRKLAAARMAEEKPGQTLQATALVHEAYLRLVNQRFFAGLEHQEAATIMGIRSVALIAGHRLDN